MAQKIVIDTDPGIDDALAVALALFEPSLDVLALVPTAGNVSAELATRNVQFLVGQLDPPKLPRMAAAASDAARESLDGALHIHGSDGLGEAHFEVAELHHCRASDQVLAEAVRAAPHEVAVLTLGPLSNLAAAFQRDPSLPRMIERVVVMGGSVAVGGNVTAAAEFNIYCDPAAARTVFHAPVPKLLVPLDVTHKVLFTLEHLERLPGEETRVGRFLRRIVPFAFRSHHEHLGMEEIYVHDAVALAALLHPRLFKIKAMVGDVETTGELTRGETVFDRRSIGRSKTNLDVAVDVDAAGVIGWMLAAARAAGRHG